MKKILSILILMLLAYTANVGAMTSEDYSCQINQDSVLVRADSAQLSDPAQGYIFDRDIDGWTVYSCPSASVFFSLVDVESIIKRRSAQSNSTDVAIGVDSVVIINRLNVNPKTFIKILVTNEDLTINFYRKTRYSLIWDIDISSKLDDKENFTKVNQESLPDSIFNYIKYNLFQDLNALFINKTDSVVNNRIKVEDFIINNRVVEALPATGDDIYNYRISVEVYKDNNCQRSSVVSSGFFFNKNWELVRHYRNGQHVDEYYVEYSPYFVDFYNLIKKIRTDFETRHR